MFYISWLFCETCPGKPVCDAALAVNVTANSFDQNFNQVLFIFHFAIIIYISLLILLIQGDIIPAFFWNQ